MSVRYRDKDGNETLVAGMGRSGELVPSVSYYQTGSGQAGSVTAGGYKDIKVTLNTAMPDTDYVIVPLISTGGDKFTVSNVFAQTTTGFTMRIHNYSSTDSDTAYTWKAFKLMTDESRALDEAAIAANTTDIASLKELTGIGGNNKRIDDTVDLNDIKEPGTYCWTSSVPTNAPSSVASTMIVQRISSDTVVQLVVEAKAGNIYKRGMYGSWQSWVQLTTTNILSPTTLYTNSSPTECKAGDTFTLSQSLANYTSIVIEYANGRTGTCNQRSFYFNDMFLNRMSLNVAHSNTQHAFLNKTSDTVLTVGGTGDQGVYITRILGRKY